MKKSVSSESMLAFLQCLLDDWNSEREKFGDDDRIVVKKFSEMIGCKDMVECLIGCPVNLGKDGKVSVGF